MINLSLCPYLINDFWSNRFWWISRWIFDINYIVRSEFVCLLMKFTIFSMHILMINPFDFNKLWSQARWQMKTSAFLHETSSIVPESIKISQVKIVWISFVRVRAENTHWLNGVWPLWHLRIKKHCFFRLEWANAIKKRVE